MCKYEVCIDGEEFEQSFTLDELIDNGLLDEYDPNIKVRAKGELVWFIAREYPYHKMGRENKTTFVINDDGTVTLRKNKSTITSSSSSSTVSSPSSSSSSSSSNRSSGASSDGCFGEIVGWVICIAIAIVIVVLWNI